MITGYLIRIEGRGLDFVVADKLASLFGFVGLGQRVRCSGFLATRYVESISEKDAIEFALRQVTAELLAKKVVDKEKLHLLELNVDEVIAKTAGTNLGPTRGFTFYRGNEDMDNAAPANKRDASL